LHLPDVLAGFVVEPVDMKCTSLSRSDESASVLDCAGDTPDAEVEASSDMSSGRNLDGFRDLTPHEKAESSVDVSVGPDELLDAAYPPGSIKFNALRIRPLRGFEALLLAGRADCG
jgi:hypothetical protein